MVYLHVEEDPWEEIWKTQWGREFHKGDFEDGVKEL